MPKPDDSSGVYVDVAVGVSVGVGVSVASVHLHVCVAVGVGRAVRELVGVTVAVREAVGVCGGEAVGINKAVGGTILVGASHDASALDEQPFKTTAPAPIPATLRKSLRETMVSV
jgi:hypothetical protein